jgi:hypothetical protein
LALLRCPDTFWLCPGAEIRIDMLVNSWTGNVNRSAPRGDLVANTKPGLEVLRRVRVYREIIIG